MKTLIIILAICFLKSPSQTWDWAKTYYTATTDEGQSVGTDQWGNIYVKGLSDSYNHGPGGISITHFLLKYSSTGNLLWKKNIPAIGYKAETDKDGNTYISGQGKAIAKFDSSGTQVWIKTYTDRHFTQVIVSPKGGVVLRGQAHLSDPCVSAIVRIDANGNELWNITNIQSFCSASVTCDSDGNTYVSGNNQIIKLDTLGVIIASIPTSTIGYPHGITVTPDYFIYESRIAHSYQTKTVTVTKYNQSGTIQWNNCFYIKTGDLINIKHDINNNIYLAGGFHNYISPTGLATLQYQNVTLTGSVSALIIKLDPFGNIIWAKQSTGSDGNICPKAFVVTSDNKVLLSGLIQSAHNLDNISISGDPVYYDIFTAKLSQSPLTSIPDKKKESEFFVNLYPSPTTGQINLDYENENLKDLNISIRNSLGQKVLYINSMNQSLIKTIDLSVLSKGIYFVEIAAGEKKTVKKIVLQ